MTAGSVEGALCVTKECLNAIGRVEGASCVAAERVNTAGRVVASGCSAKERIKTVGRVARSGCEAEERIITLSRVIAGVASVRWWRNGSDCWQKRKAGESEREKKTESQRRPVE